MQFRMLGPLEVVGDRGSVPLGRGKRRSLLALLLIHANEVVSADRLIDALWGERPPAAPRTALQVLVSELRKALAESDGERLVTRPSGYVLETRTGEVDVDRFTRLLEHGRQALAVDDPETAGEKLREALGLWRGPPLLDVAYEDFAQPEIARLEELRAQAEEELVEAELRRGRLGELVPRLESLISAYPQRERLRGQLMLALYRDQRQAEALAAYQEARAMLLHDLGVEPSPALRRLHQAILNQSPELEIEPPAHRVLPRPPRRPRRALLAMGAAAALAVAGLAVGVTLAISGGKSKPAPITSVPPRSVVEIDPVTNRLEAVVRLEPQPVATPPEPTDIAVAGGDVWVADAAQQAILRIDPTRSAVVDTIGVGLDVQSLAAGFGSIWVADGSSAAVTRIDAHTDRVTATIGLGGAGRSLGTSFAIAAGAGSVWATAGESFVARIDPRTDRVVERVPVRDPRTLAANTRFVWCGTKNGEILRISPRGKRSGVKKFARVQTDIVAMRVRGNALWAAVDGPSFEIWQYDATTGRLASTIVAGEIVLDLAVGPNAVWVPLYREGEVIRLDATRNEIVRRIVVRPGLRAVAIGDRAVWALAS